MRKVFRYFIKSHGVKKLQVGILVTIGIIISVIIIGILLNPVEKTIEIGDLIDEEIITEKNVTPEIQEKLDEIKKKNLENQYTPKDREWITSGPFQIDRSEYILGEKIFMRIGGLQPNEQGQVIFLRPLNETHHTIYLTIPFDGMQKEGFNYYVEPDLSKMKNICAVEDILGEWIIVLKGTEYENLYFKIINEILPGEEDDYNESVC
jgi:hypothetical protein